MTQDGRADLLERVTAAMRRIGCHLGWHPCLDVIQSYGPAQHVGCPYCRREYGIHHGIEVIIPWDDKLSEMYRFLGYDIDGPTMRWRAYKP